MKRLLILLGITWSLSSAVGVAYAASLPNEVSAISKMLNPGGYFELQPGAGVRYAGASLKSEPRWWVGGKVLASPRKWLGVEGVIQFDVPGHNRPRAEAATFVRF